MKTLSFATLLLISLLLANATPLLARTTPAIAPTDTTVGEPATYKLTVVFANIKQRTGMIYVGLANDEASFDGSLYRKTRVSVPASGEVTVSFESLPAGTYAVRVYQDLNENAKLDWAGPMPTEPYGFSNVQQLLGPPKFRLSAFDLTADKQVSVKLLGL